jgi:protein subunit release factor A
LGRFQQPTKSIREFTTLSPNLRLLERLKQWEEWRGDSLAAMEMAHDDSVADDERDLFYYECLVNARALLEDGKSFELELLLSGPYDNQPAELELLLSGPYDNQPARLILTAGAGGTEANDWVADLKRMYERHAEKKGYRTTIEDAQTEDQVGFKTVEMLIEGPNASP